MPSGREIHSLKPFVSPELESTILESLRAPPDRDRTDDYGGDASSGEEIAPEPVGAFPGTRGDYTSSSKYY
jgi:hypothetical protein